MDTIDATPILRERDSSILLDKKIVEEKEPKLKPIVTPSEPLEEPPITSTKFEEEIKREKEPFFKFKKPTLPTLSRKKKRKIKRKVRQTSKKIYKLSTNALKVSIILFLVIGFIQPNFLNQHAPDRVAPYIKKFTDILTDIKDYIKNRIRPPPPTSSPVITPPMTEKPEETFTPTESPKPILDPLPPGYTEKTLITDTEYRNQKFPTPVPNFYTGGVVGIYGDVTQGILKMKKRVYVFNFSSEHEANEFVGLMVKKYGSSENIPQPRKFESLTIYHRSNNEQHLGTFFQLNKNVYFVRMHFSKEEDEEFIREYFIIETVESVIPEPTEKLYKPTPYEVEVFLDQFPDPDFDNPYLKAHVKTITKDCPTYGSACQLHTIYKYVIENFDYRYEPTKMYFQTPAQTLEKGYGVCIDFTVLFYNYLTASGITTYVVDCPEDSHAYAVACDVDINTLKKYISNDLRKLSGRYVIPDLEFEVNKVFGRECLHLEGPPKEKDEITMVMDYPGRHVDVYIDPETNEESPLIGKRYAIDPITENWDEIEKSEIYIIRKKPFN